jgi:hypothetical protein
VRGLAAHDTEWQPALHTTISFVDEGMRRQFRTLVTIGIVAGGAAVHPAAAQLIDVHGNASVETAHQSTSWGGGLGVGTIFVPAGFATLGLSLGADYIRAQHLGRPIATAALDAAFSPSSGGGASFVPYAGGSLGLNWSGGEFSQWTGARLGLDAIAGVKALFGGQDQFGWKVEGRFGYVRGAEHAYSTRLGLLFGL